MAVTGQSDFTVFEAPIVSVSNFLKIAKKICRSSSLQIQCAFCLSRPRVFKELDHNYNLALA